MYCFQGLSQLSLTQIVKKQNKKTKHSHTQSCGYHYTSGRFIKQNWSYLYLKTQKTKIFTAHGVTIPAHGIFYLVQLSVSYPNVFASVFTLSTRSLLHTSSEPQSLVKGI